MGSVTTDNVRGAYNAIEYLIKKGHKHIGMIQWTCTSAMSKYQERLEGYCRALEYHQIPYREDWIADGSFSEKGGFESAITLLSKQP